jgi:hypothetical protein
LTVIHELHHENAAGDEIKSHVACKVHWLLVALCCQHIMVDPAVCVVQDIVIITPDSDTLSILQVGAYSTSSRM